jgi:glycosyltransferase involved in cell wall biosynthesis
MRILFTTPTFPPYWGGAEVLLDDLSRALAALGHRVVVVTSRRTRDVPAREQRAGVRVLRFDYPPRRADARGPRAYLPGVADLAAGLFGLVRRRRVHVVCVGLVGLESALVLALRSRLRFRLVVYLHGGELRDYGRHSPFMRRTLRGLLAACDAAVAVSQALAREAVEFFPAVGPRVTVLPNGVDLALFRRPVPRPHARPYALYAGRLVPRKRVDLLLDAFRRIASQAPDLDLLIAGFGPEEDRLRTLAAAAGLGDRVRFLGRQGRAEIAALLQGCELVVLPSDDEGYPMIAAEAQAAGAVLLGSRVAGTREVVEHERTGLLFTPGDADELAELMRRVYQQPEWRQAIAARARARGAERDIRELAERHLAVYAGGHDRCPASVAG